MDYDITRRKLEHIRIVLEENIDFPGNCGDLYDLIVLVHQSFPQISLEDVDLQTTFLGYKLKAPLIISGMTGGHKDITRINQKLAELAETAGIGIGLGSQRAMIIKRNERGILESYRIVREIAVHVPVIGNIGANTLNDLSIEQIEEAVKTIEVDALAIHLNPAQEVIQPEGDTRFRDKILERIEEISERLDIPVIIKEVGNGLSIETVKLFGSIGIRFFDVAGACGTNWILVEKYRDRTPHMKRVIADTLSNWGIPTPISLIETRFTVPTATIIASGGVWDGLKAAKLLALGADIIGIAKPIIKKLLIEGYDEALAYIKTYIETLRTVFFLTGSRNIFEIRRKPLLLLEPFPTYLRQRGIDLSEYINYVRRGRH